MVAVADIDDAGGASVAAEIGEPAFFQALDVTDEDAWRSVMEAAAARLGLVDILVNSAGFSRAARSRTPASRTGAACST